MPRIRVSPRQHMRALRRLRLFRKKLTFMNTRVKALEKRMHDMEMALRARHA